MMPLANLKLRSAKMKKRNGDFYITAADTVNLYFKRDVNSTISKLKEKLQNEKSVEQGFEQEFIQC